MGKIVQHNEKGTRKYRGILCDNRNHSITTAITKTMAKNCIGYSMEFLKRESDCCYDYCLQEWESNHRTILFRIKFDLFQIQTHDQNATRVIFTVQPKFAHTMHAFKHVLNA